MSLGPFLLFLGFLCVFLNQITHLWPWIPLSSSVSWSTPVSLGKTVDGEDRAKGGRVIHTENIQHTQWVSGVCHNTSDISCCKATWLLDHVSLVNKCHCMKKISTLKMHLTNLFPWWPLWTLWTLVPFYAFSSIWSSLPRKSSVPLITLKCK